MFSSVRFEMSRRPDIVVKEVYQWKIKMVSTPISFLHSYYNTSLSGGKGQAVAATVSLLRLRKLQIKALFYDLL